LPFAVLLSRVLWISIPDRNAFSTHFVRNSKEEYDEDNSDDWPSQWIRFATLLPGTGEIPSKNDTQACEEWIETAVTIFAKRIQTRSKFAEFWEQGA
jgi:hypothetical protein